MPKTCQFVKDSISRAANLHFGTVKLMVLDAKTKTFPLEMSTNYKLRTIVPVQLPQEFKMTLGKDTLGKKTLKITFVYFLMFKGPYSISKSFPFFILITIHIVQNMYFRQIFLKML